MFERIRQLFLYTRISSGVMWCVWSSSANLSISRHISSVRPTSNMFLRNFSSRMNRYWIPKKNFFLHFLRVRDEILVIPWLLPVTVPVGVVLSLCSNWGSRGDPRCTGRIACSPPFRCARCASTCNRRCRRPSMVDIRCTVLWVPYRVVHTIRNFMNHLL